MGDTPGGRQPDEPAARTPAEQGPARPVDPRFGSVAVSGRPGGVVRSWRHDLAGVCVVALGCCVVLPTRPDAAPTTALVGVLAVASTAGALLLRSPVATRTAVFVDTMVVCYAASAFGGWPPVPTAVVVCAVPPLVLYAAGRRADLRPVMPWCRRGRLTPEAPWFGIATVLGSGLALSVWALAVRPEPAPYFHDLQDLPLWLAVLGVVGFALVNPVWEELLFRGVLLTELARVWGPWAGVTLQAVLFGAAHYAGFPSGVAGMLMAAGWGAALGVMRVRSGGILIPYVVHVTANAVIGVLAITVLR